MSRKAKEIVADAMEMAKLTAADMATLGAVHAATLSKYANPENKLEPDPQWTHRFIVRLANLYDERLDRLVELIEESAELVYSTPEYAEMAKMVQADMKARGKKGSGKWKSAHAGRLRKKSEARRRGQ